MTQTQTLDAESSPTERDRTKDPKVPDCGIVESNERSRIALRFEDWKMRIVKNCSSQNVVIGVDDSKISVLFKCAARYDRWLHFGPHERARIHSKMQQMAGLVSGGARISRCNRREVLGVQRVCAECAE